MQATTKAILREQLQLRRWQISAKNRTAYSRLIVERLIALVELHDIHRVHCYAPIVRKAEVDTWPFLRYLWVRPNITVVVPGPLKAGGPTAYIVSAETSWHETKAAPLPTEKVSTNDSRFDLVVVPCLGFDNDRYRLGNGGGYYDRLLALQTNAIVVGLSFWAGYVPKGLTHESHDIPLQQIITEEKVI